MSMYQKLVAAFEVPTPAYQTTEEVRVHFNLRNADTVRRWAKQGAPHLRVAPSDLRWKVVELRKWLDEKSKETEVSNKV